MNIPSNLSNIYDLDTLLFSYNKLVDSFFNGILLKKKGYFDVYQEKVIIPNILGTSPLDTNVAKDMTDDYCLFFRNNYMVMCHVPATEQSSKNIETRPETATEQSNDNIETRPETATEQSNNFKKTTESTTLHYAPIENIDCETVPTY